MKNLSGIEIEQGIVVKPELRGAINALSCRAIPFLLSVWVGKILWDKLFNPALQEKYWAYMNSNLSVLNGDRLDPNVIEVLAIIAIGAALVTIMIRTAESVIDVIRQTRKTNWQYSPKDRHVSFRHESHGESVSCFSISSSQTKTDLLGDNKIVITGIVSCVSGFSEWLETRTWEIPFIYDTVNAENEVKLAKHKLENLPR